jgi:hypothetical protein
MTAGEDNTVRLYKRIAEDVRAKLEKLHIKSSNKFWNLNKAATGAQLGLQRPPEMGGTGPGYVDDQDAANIISVTKAGNCGEKGMAYGWWATQHGQYAAAGSPRVYTVDLDSTGAWDHMWAVMCTANLNVGDTVNLAAFGLTAVMLDGWSEDYYFPNVGKIDSIRLDIWRFQNPFQMFVRGKVKKLGKNGNRITVNGVVA